MSDRTWGKWLQRGWGAYNVLSTIVRNQRADDHARRNLITERQHHQAVEQYFDLAPETRTPV